MKAPAQVLLLNNRKRLRTGIFSSIQFLAVRMEDVATNPRVVIRLALVVAELVYGLFRSVYQVGDCVPPREGPCHVSTGPT